MIDGPGIRAMFLQLECKSEDGKVQLLGHSHSTFSMSFVIKSDTKSARNLCLLYKSRTVFIKGNYSDNNICKAYSNVGTTVIDNVIRYFVVFICGFIKCWILSDPFIYLFVSLIC